MDILGLVSVPVWLVMLMTLLLIVFIYGRQKHSVFESLGIHSMPGTIILGSFPYMLKKGYNFIDADLVKEHGKVFGLYMGNKPWLIVSDTDLIKEITVKQFHNFTDRNPLGPIHKRWYSSLNIAEGSHWKFLRTILSPTFSSGKLRHMSPLIQSCLNDLHNNVDRNIREHSEGFDIIPLINGLTMDVICNTGFGIQANAQTDLDNTFVRNAKSLLEVRFTVLPVIFLDLFFPDLDFILNKFRTNFIPMKTFEYLKAATLSAFEARKESGSTHKDLLKLMINAHKGEEESLKDGSYTYDEFKKRGLTDEEVLINSMFFISAGYDTTASALSWCMYRLVIHPEIQDKLVQEIDSELGQECPDYDNVAKLHYLDMVMNETLRMHPPAGRFDRIALEDTNINGTTIKKGTAVIFPTLALHYMAEHWESPNEFKPERFAPENQHNINQYAFMPFGQGPRHCIAMRLAHLEFKMTIVSLLQRYRLVKSDKLETPMPMALTLIARPAKPVMIKAIRREIRV